MLLIYGGRKLREVELWESTGGCVDKSECPVVLKIFRQFASDERGAATLEFVLWVPPMPFMLIGAVDASVLYFTRTDMFNVSRDVARKISVGSLTVDQVAAYVSQTTHLGGRTYSVATIEGATIVVAMSVGIGDASVFGIFRPVLDDKIGVRVEMRREPSLEVT